MKIYYWNTKPNFGDRLTSLLLMRFTGLNSEWAEIEDADLVIIGSILEHIPYTWKGVIAGVGKMHEKTVVTFPYAKIISVRGKLTANSLGISLKDVTIGDPALLANELVALPEKEYDLGLVPHWTDTSLELNPIFKKFKPKIIRVADDPLKVITEIGKCKKIVSSSLHGIILADAFGIPRRIELAPRMITHTHQEGGIFKWRDYSSGIGVKLELSKTQQIDRNMIADKQSELFDMFEKIKKIFK